MGGASKSTPQSAGQNSRIVYKNRGNEPGVVFLCFSQKSKVVGSKDDIFGEATGSRKKTEEGYNIYTEVSNQLLASSYVIAILCL